MRADGAVLFVWHLQLSRRREGVTVFQVKLIVETMPHVETD